MCRLGMMFPMHLFIPMTDGAAGIDSCLSGIFNWINVYHVKELMVAISG